MHDNPKSRIEAVLQNIVGESNQLESPISSTEAILQAILNSSSYTDEPKSRVDELLLAIKNGGSYDGELRSRVEEILYAILTSGSYTEEPKSRVEELLIEWLNGSSNRYEFINWIGSNKGISVGLKTTKNTEIRTKIIRANTGVAQYIYCSDSNSSGTTNTTAYMSNGGATANWRFGNRTLSIGVPVGQVVETKQNYEGVWLDGVSVGSYSTIGNFTSNNNLSFFGTTTNPDLQLYEAQVYDNGVLVRDIVPCHDTISNVLGLYDRVNNHFYTNSDATIIGG